MKFFMSNRINPKIPEGPLTLRQVQQKTSVLENSYQHIYWVDADIIQELNPDILN